MPLAKMRHSRTKEPKIVVSEPTLTVLLAQDEDGSYCAKCPELDLVTQLPSAEAALKDLLAAVRDYAAEYLRKCKVYAASSNRAHHRPYVEAIAACQTEWELRTLIEIKHGLVRP